MVVKKLVLDSRIRISVPNIPALLVRVLYIIALVVVSHICVEVYALIVERQSGIFVIVFCGWTIRDWRIGRVVC